MRVDCLRGEPPLQFDMDKVIQCLQYISIWEERRDRLHRALAELQRAKLRTV